VTTRRHTPTREHDLRMHLGVIYMAVQMISRPPTTPLHPDQQELIDIIKRAAKSMQDILETPPSRSKKKGNTKNREG
jgi:light-regulated signal transduction histidine kinase (bacteriophytochrome)